MATVAELLAQLRLDLEDPELPGSGDDSDSLWLDSELLHYLNEAQRRFAVQTLCLPDSTNYTSSVSDGTTWVDKDASIIRIIEGWLSTAQKKITPVNRVDIERGYETDDYGTRLSSAWRTATGTPEFVVTDLDAIQNRLVPIATASDTIEWLVYRYPLEAISSTSSPIEIEEQFHYDLMVWAKVLAHKKQDAETQDMTRSRDWEREWNDRIIPEAKQFFMMKFRKLGTTGYGGIT